MDGKLCPLFNEKREVLPSLPSRSLLDLNLFPFLTLLLYHLFFSPVLQLIENTWKFPNLLPYAFSRNVDDCCI